MLQQEAIAQFRTQFGGALIEPGDTRYADARKVYNGMIDRKPRLIAQSADVADTLAVSIRCRGHNAGGLGVCDDGLVIDLSEAIALHIQHGSKMPTLHSSMH